MRILHWTESFWPRIGGAENFVRLLATETFERGHESVVLSDVADGLPPHDEVDGVPIRRFPFQAALASRDLGEVVSLAQQATAFVRELAPAVVHLHTSQPGAFFFMRMHRALCIPSVFTTHDPLDIVGAENQLVGHLLDAVQAIAGISPFMSERVAAAFPKTAPRIRCIPNGLPWPDRQPSPLPWNPPVVLAVGRLTRPKGFDVVVKALASVCRDVPDVTLVVAGDGADRDELQELARDLGLGEHVRFMGWVPPCDIAGVIDRATVVAIPSRWDEPFGLVALEAMQMARPVVASRVGGLPDVVRHEQSGWLVPPDDPEALGEAIRTVLSNCETATKMGQAGREIARTDFDWTRCADSYQDLYREVAE